MTWCGSGMLNGLNELVEGKDYPKKIWDPSGFIGYNIHNWLKKPVEYPFISIIGLKKNKRFPGNGL